MKKTVKLIITFTIAFILIGGIIFSKYLNRTKFPTNDQVGNSSGNLYNKGLFCERDGTVFFSNPNDAFSLYSMDSNGTNIKKLSSDQVAYLNADDHYIFYTRSNSSVKSDFAFLHIQNYSLCRLQKNGKKEFILDSNPCLYSTQYEGEIYYIHYDKETASTLYKISINGKNKKQVSKSPILPISKSKQILYYAGTESDHFLHFINTKTNTTGIAYKGNCYNPIVENNTVYFMDVDQDYALAKVDLSTGVKTIISNERLDCFNLYGNTIYYQYSSQTTPALFRIQTDGTKKEKIADGNYTNINITSRYVYFYDFKSPKVCFYTPTNGPVQVQLFNPVSLKK